MRNILKDLELARCEAVPIFSRAPGCDGNTARAARSRNTLSFGVKSRLRDEGIGEITGMGIEIYLEMHYRRKLCRNKTGE